MSVESAFFSLDSKNKVVFLPSFLVSLCQRKELSLISSNVEHFGSELEQHDLN